MKIGIDISVTSNDGSAFGRIFGSLELEAIPGAGDTISFAYSKVDSNTKPPNGFLGFLKVTERVFEAVPRFGDVTLMLSDLIVKDEGQAKDIMLYFSKGFDLDFEFYD